MKKQKPVDRLMESIELLVHLRGRAQWYNGYRCGNPEKQAELYDKEMHYWSRADVERRRLRRSAQRLLRTAARGEGA